MGFIGEVNHRLDASTTAAIAIAPGFSTVFAGMKCEDKDAQKSAIIIGIVQLLLVPLLVGWIWAIMSACKIYNNSK